MADARRAAPAALNPQAPEDAGGVQLLRGVLAAGACAGSAEAFDAEALPNLMQLAMRGPLLEHCRRRLGPHIACDIDRCFVRRQRPPPGHAPHSWHQDGALNADFASDTAPLRMLTCWIALTPCGRDAPGLQWVATPLPRLLAPPELTEAAVRERFADAPWCQPELAAGDALLFGGQTLHRTHLTPSMTAGRTSAELRLFPATELPPRLAGDRFVAVD